jgi:poly(hydroxyalkanoate) depolymerase family esterase
VNVQSISQTIDSALIAAGLDPKAGALQAVTATIEKALASAGLAQLRRPLPGNLPTGFVPGARVPGSLAKRDVAATDVGQFLSLSHASRLGSRAYKLYVPSSYDGRPAPLIVMLHGCKQNPDDFAAGTRMNALAEREGFLVAYPAQTPRENGGSCWNWFEGHQQSREGIEPSLIAGIVGEIGKSHAVDSSRVFVAGLSAGAAMAVILGATYPELFAGVAAHSGLPVGAAHDVTSAFAAMRGGAASSNADVRRPAVPTIVFHGDADHTVALSNGSTIVGQALQAYADADTALRKSRRSPQASDGARFTTTDYLDADGRHRVEQWVVHGGAHTWFGGSPDGSHTEPSGPDASAEIVRFFLSQKPIAP